VVKVQVEANELRNGNIEKISLVTNGAIRQPFKILKTEEITEGTQTMGEKISKFFSGKTDDGKAQVAAVYVRKDVAAKWVPIIKSNGFRAEKDHAALEGDVLVLKQESYDSDAAGSVIALTPDVAIQFDRVIKYFDPYPESANFDDNVKAAGFYPGMSNALSTLADTVWNVLNESEDTEEAAEMIGKQIKSFGLHVKNLVSELPSSVFKMEQESLTKEFEGSTVSTSDTKITVTKDEEDTMTKPVLKEVAAGDLDGLLDDAPAADAALAKADAEIEKGVAEEATGAEVVYLDADGNEISEAAFDALDAEVQKGYVLKGGDEGAPMSGGSPGNAVVESTSDTGAVSLDEGGVPAGFRKEERMIKQIEDGKLVEKTALYFVNDDTKEEIFGGFVEKSAESADPVAATQQADGVQYSPAEIKLFEALGVLVKEVTGIKEQVAKQAEQIEVVAKTAEVAKETAEDTVVLNVADNLDESLATLQGHQSAHQVVKNVEKADEDIFKGLLPQLESSAA